MPNDKQCNIARELTGSGVTNLEINMQYDGLSISDRFIMSNSIERMLRTNNIAIEDAWEELRPEIEDIASEYLIDPAVAFCIYTDWKREHSSEQ